MGKFKTKVDFRREALEAVRNRVLDTTEQRSESEVKSAMKHFMDNAYPTLATPQIEAGLPWQSKFEQYYLKELKYYVNLQNLKTNKIKNLVDKSVKENFATLRELQRELLTLLSETTEEESKLIGGYSKVHYNSFVRGIDAPMEWKNLSGLKDFKTGFAFKQKQLMKPLQKAGLSLPVREHFEVPVLDAYIVDELTDVGDSMYPIQTSPPKNLIRKNKVFNHIIVRKEYDHSSRKFKSKTSYDQYPYNCVSTMTIELEMPSMVQINYFTFEPCGGSTIYIPENGLTYKSEDGSEISLSTLTIPGEVSTTLIFQPIHTKYLRIKFEQYGTVGRKDIVIGDKKVKAFNDLLASTEMNARYPHHDDHVKGRVYDFSLANVSVGLYAFEPKGIFRSGTSLSVDSPLGFDFRWEAEQLIPFESFDTYLRSAILPEGRTLLESYLHTKLYGGKEAGASIAPIYTGGKKRKRKDLLRDTLLVDSLVPIPDSYPIQVEYMDFVQDKAKAKLFPNVKIKNKARVIDICLKKYDISNLSDGAAGIAALGLDLEPSKLKKLYSNIGLDTSTISTAIISSSEIPEGRIFDSSNDEHVSAKYLFKKAIKDMTALKRDNLQKELTVVFKSPSDEDIAFLMGDLWYRAAEDLKELIRSKPQDFLLLSEGIIYGSSKKIENKPSETVTLYCRSHIYSNSINSIRTPLGQALMNTKLVELTIENFDGSGDADFVEINLKPVRRIINKSDPVISHLSSKDRALVEHFSEINFHANTFRKEAVRCFTEEISSAYGMVDNSFPNFRTNYDSNDDGINDSSLPKLWDHLEPYWYKFVVSLLRNKPVIKRESVDINILGGLSGGKGQVYKQTHGKQGSTLFHPVRYIYDNPNCLIDPKDIHIGDKSTAGSISASELLKTMQIDEWYYDYAASLAGIALSPNLPEHKDVSCIVNNWFKPLEQETLTKDILRFKALPSSEHTEDFFNSSWLKDSSVLKISNIDNKTIEPKDPMTNDSFDFLKSFFRKKESVLTWKFTVDGEHNVGVGDIVGFRTKPYATLDGQYYVVGIEENAFYVRVFDDVTGKTHSNFSPIITTISPGDCDQTKTKYPNIDFSINDYSFPMLGPLGGEDILVINHNDEDCPENYIFYTDGNPGDPYFNVCLWNDAKAPLPLTILATFSPQSFATIAESWVSGDVLNNANLFGFRKYEVLDNDGFDPSQNNTWGEIDIAPGNNYLFAELMQIFTADFLDDKPEAFESAENITACCKAIDLAQVSLLSFNAAFDQAPIEVYENNCLLTIGEDYDISLNSGAEWLGTFPLDTTYEFFMRKAKAGNFYIRIRSPKPSSVYWLSYRVAPNQELSEQGRIFLKNGRVTCDKIVGSSNGKVDTVIVARTRTANPYLTPLLRNYSLRIQENANELKQSGKLEAKRVNLISKKSTINVS